MTVNNATTWALEVFESDLSATQKLICLYLRTHMNDYREMAWPSVGRIADKCNVSERTVFRELPKICKAGYLMQNGVSDRGTVRYAICTPTDTPPDIVSPLTQCHDTPDIVSPELTKELTNTLSKGSKRFVKPSVQQIAEYQTEASLYKFDAESFVDYWESVGWKRGRTPMKDWKATARTWAKNEEKRNGKTRPAGRKNTRSSVEEISISDLINEGHDLIG